MNFFNDIEILNIDRAIKFMKFELGDDQYLIISLQNNQFIMNHMQLIKNKPQLINSHKCPNDDDHRDFIKSQMNDDQIKIFDELFN